MLLRAGGREGHDRERAARIDHQPVLLVGARPAPRRALHRQQGRNHHDDAHDGARAGAAGIRANAIAPGTTDTAQSPGGLTEEELAAFARAVPLGRIAQPEDVASVAVFLATEESRHGTGQTLQVNGGVYMR